jgi:hypothetical protein
MIKYYETSEVNAKQQELLEADGYHIYGLRDWDGRGYGIEPGRVVVNNIGVLITDQELPMPDGFMSSEEFYNRSDIEEMSYDEVQRYLGEFKNTNFHFRIKGDKVDFYWMCRTYDLTIAKKHLKSVLKQVKEKDPTATAEQFGHAEDNRDFSEVYSQIKNIR